MTALPRKALAAVFLGASEQVACFTDVIELWSFDLPPILDDQILVRVTCCTICGSDLHTTLGNRPAPTPSVLGHEIIGVVEAIGSDIRCDGLSIGDRITWAVAASCGPTSWASSHLQGNGGTCFNCERGLPQKCASLFKYGHEAVTDDAARTLSGGLTEYCVLQPGTGIVKLPESVSDEILSPASCATATVMAAVRVAGSLTDKRVLVTGAGMLGLTTAAVAATRSAMDVTVCDVSPSRLDQAMQFGATRVLDAVPDEQFDCIFEMSGNVNAVAAAIDAAAIGAHVILVGSVSPSQPVPLDPERVVRRLMSIHGVHNYCPDDLWNAVEFLAEHHERFPFESLVEKTFSLTETAAAFEYAAKHRPIRVAVKPNADS